MFSHLAFFCHFRYRELKKGEDYISKRDDELEGIDLIKLTIPMLKNELHVRGVSSNFLRK